MSRQPRSDGMRIGKTEAEMRAEQEPTPAEQRVLDAIAGTPLNGWQARVLVALREYGAEQRAAAERHSVKGPVIVECDGCGQLVSIPRSGSGICGCAGTTWSLSKGREYKLSLTMRGEGHVLDIERQGDDDRQ